MRVGVFGLGEAGGLIAGDLAAAGATVIGYDPRPTATPTGVRRVDNPSDAVRGVEFVCALTAAADAVGAITQALDDIPATAIYADFATSAAGLKRDLAAIAGSRGIGFVDVALMSTVPGNGLRTPALASGSAAKLFVEVVAPLGMPVEDAGPEAGAAATRKLLRSVVMKGLAGLIIESMPRRQRRRAR